MKLRNALGLLVVLAAFGAAGCGGDETARAKPTSGPQDGMLLAAQDVARSDSADLVSGVSVSGTLTPWVDVHIASPIPEVLDEVRVREGEPVVKGQVLARFRTTALAPAAVVAETQARIAASDHERMKNLFGAGAISEREMEGAEAAWREAQAQLALAKKRLEEATVRAPVSGTIAKRWVQSGDRVGDGDPLFRLVNNADLEFVATVPAEYASRLKPGAAALLAVNGHSGTREGTVVRVSPTADPATRQIKLYVRIANANRELVGDQFATGRVVLARALRALAVPRAAVRGGVDGKPWVWVIAGGRAEKRALTIGIVDEERDLVQVTSGLKTGDAVIVAPAEGLVPGKPIAISPVS